ncbi:MAG: hypothetical protein LBG92_10240 [Prevotellaceae bacterium]|jgi:hypothetical protein|nr:hypothetical protein [Prevotellaceae bacterium]
MATDKLGIILGIPELRKGGIIGVIVILFTVFAFFEKKNVPTEQNTEKKLNEDVTKRQTQLNVYFNNPLSVRIIEDDMIIYCDTTLNHSIRGYQSGFYCFSNTKEGTIILESIESAIRDYLTNDSTTEIIIHSCGHTDKPQVKQGVYYNGVFGDIPKTKYHLFNTNTYREKEFIANKTIIQDNYDMAFLRAYDIVNFLKNRFPIKERNIKIYVMEHDKKGEEYRGVDFSITLGKIVSTAKNELSWFWKFFYELDN